MITAIIFLLILTTAVMVHEAAHYLSAKSVGVPVRAFSIGMGPVIFKKQWRDTEWRISLLPLGGYVDIPSMGAKADEDGNYEYYEDGFTTKKLWEKLFILVAGVVANYLLFIILLSTVITIVPNYRSLTSGLVAENSGAIVDGIMEGYTAEALGIEAGDIFLEINGIKDPNASQVSQSIRDASPKLLITFKRGEKTINIASPWPPELKEGQERPLLGVQIAPLVVKDLPKINFFQAIAETVVFSFKVVPDVVKGFVKGFASALSAKQSEDIAGPVGIVKMVDSARKVGIIPVLALAAFINLSLGVFNLLPIPGLDGGRMVLATITSLRGKPLPPGREEFIHFIGFMSVIVLMLLITFKELGGLFLSG